MFGGYMPITDSNIYYGINATLGDGIEADFRELHVTQGFISEMDEEAQEKYIHYSKTVQSNVLGYYKFDQDGYEYLNDYFRPQRGKAVYSVDADDQFKKVKPEIIQDGKSNFYCDRIVPQ